MIEASDIREQVNGDNAQDKGYSLHSLVPRPVELVLSLFPGIGLLDYAFEAEGFQVVRGPDKLWGGDVCRFHVPPGIFAGVERKETKGKSNE